MTPASFTLRFLTTLLVLAVAAVVGWQLWNYYMEAPWTRDGRVRADIISLAPDVTGPVVQVFVHDNQVVHVGDKLFQIDPVRFTLALQQAQAAVARTHAAMEDAKSTAARYAAASSSATSGLNRDQVSAAAQEAEAEYNQALANLGVAQLNLHRSTVYATVNGMITNFSMQPGDYVTAGAPVLAIVDSDSLYVDAYLEETKMRGIAPGDAAKITLMQGGPAITGHVSGIAAGIADVERRTAPTLLADVNPTFTWVRLAARIPVRVELDHVPDGVRLVAGMTCTVSITPRDTDKDQKPQ
ncbi:efflux RND transporter periplasmic adaptor subunit [Acidocella aromatica]|uniref:RND family efflux transporter MFP subunit n=1 Tax=Acidocella aromatica TaxID=1303579 RepID=A0A840VB12_9PROT|nr:HlyD family secretion protein [Acidocella aromatica]MBB5372963.1 RND family efflux transporter MFP subunit [Acidocella aromatica]